MSPNPQMRVFIVNTGALPTLHASSIEAAYYKSEQGFTTFKDTDNQPVFTVRDDHLVSVERAHGAEPVIAAFTQALQQANRDGTATVGFRNGSTDEASGRTVETGYDITVTRFGGVSPATV
jgi:hypothetical protein